MTPKNGIRCWLEAQWLNYFACLLSLPCALLHYSVSTPTHRCWRPEPVHFSLHLSGTAVTQGAHGVEEVSYWDVCTSLSDVCVCTLAQLCGLCKVVDVCTCLSVCARLCFKLLCFQCHRLLVWRSYGRAPKMIHLEANFVQFKEELLPKDGNRALLTFPFLHIYWTDCCVSSHYLM